MFSQKSFHKRQFVSSALAITASVLAVAGFVYSATTIGTNVSIDGNLTVSGTSATSTFSTGGLTVGTNQFVVQQTSGNIGIGTTSPTSLFHVSGSGAIFRITGASGNHITQTFARDAVGDKAVIGLAANAGSLVSGSAQDDLVIRGNTQKILFSTDSGATSALTITTSGNVGIGTTSPAQLLSVAGDAYIAGTGTTTLSLKTTTASRGTCLEMFDGAGAVYRVFVSTGGILTVAAGTCK